MQPIDFICFKCKHFDVINGGCKAFPDGIPDEITMGENSHIFPLKQQQNNIVFEPREKNDDILINE